ncbi:DUF5313 domain-containing protein [uncultured Mycolicibacterium sp.]|uniref:DUF5313 domain-containing protein n=1 Tax=uncultured Mycolicibacterium sp. TaxID=2320817 RepID=UPI002636C305|nr:DUF5313 domain-containing protein [uncultured Mycolicibacterium sp.]
MAADKPNLWQYILYSYGKRLPDSMRDWVANDLTGPGAIRRHVLRMAIPPIFVLAPLWLLPASLYVHMEMTVPIYIWAILMSVALNKVWRRHRLAQHGIPPKLIDDVERQKKARMHEDYIRRFGPRSEESDWHSSSAPF